MIAMPTSRAPSPQFSSKNCLAEMLRAVFMEKKIRVVMANAKTAGGLTIMQAKQQLAGAFRLFEEMGLTSQVKEWLEELYTEEVLAETLAERKLAATVSLQKFFRGSPRRASVAQAQGQRDALPETPLKTAPTGRYERVHHMLDLEFLNSVIFATEDCTGPEHNLIDHCRIIEWERVGCFLDINLRVLVAPFLKLPRSKQLVESSISNVNLILKRSSTMTSSTMSMALRASAMSISSNFLPRNEDAQNEDKRTPNATAEQPRTEDDAIRPSQLYIARELNALGAVCLKRPRKAFHLYVSQNNPGAEALVQELKQLLPCMSGLTYTSDATKAEECDCMLLLLNGLTWNGVNTSSNLALEVMSVLAARRPYILAHESEAFEADQDRNVARYGVDFATFFDCTPKHLISSGLYHPIAVMLKGGIKREASLTQLAAEFAKPSKRELWPRLWHARPRS